MAKNNKLWRISILVCVSVLFVCALGAWWAGNAVRQFAEELLNGPQLPVGTPAAGNWQLDAPVNKVQYHPSGQMVAVLQQGGNLTFRDIAGGAIKSQFELSETLDWALNSNATATVATPTLANQSLEQSNGVLPSVTPHAGETQETGNLGEVWPVQSIMAFNQDGTMLAAAAAVHKQTCLDSYTYPSSPYACPRSVSGTWEAITLLWRVEPREEGSYSLSHMETLTHTTFPAYYESPRDIEPVPHSLAFSPSGATLAVGNSDGSVMLWDTKSGHKSGRLPGSQSPFHLYYSITGLGWSADGRALYTGDWNETMRKWQMPEGKLLSTASHSDTHSRGHSTHVAKECYLFSPDGQLEATASWAYEIALWRLDDGKLLRTIGDRDEERQWSSIHSLAFRPDSLLIASAGGLENCDSGCGSSDPSVRIWRVADGRQLALFSGHTETVWSLDWSPDGHTIVSGGGEGNVMFWDVSRVQP